LDRLEQLHPHRLALVSAEPPDNLQRLLVLLLELLEPVRPLVRREPLDRLALGAEGFDPLPVRDVRPEAVGGEDAGGLDGVADASDLEAVAAEGEGAEGPGSSGGLDDDVFALGGARDGPGEDA
jgi:hypothetical protein